MIERKRLIAIGVDGPPLPLESAAKAQWFPFEPSKGTVVFGIQQRNENDIEMALRVANQEITPSRRMFVKELDIEVTKDQPHINWQNEFWRSLAGLQPGEVLVSAHIAKIYERLFLFERVEENGEEYYFLRGERRRPARVRGLKSDHAELIGRKREVERLDELLEQIAVDQGQILGVVGEAGIGKTRMLATLKDLCAKKSVPLIEAVAKMDETRPFQAFRDIVVGLVGAKIHTLSRWEMSDTETDFLRLFLDPGIQIDRLKELNSEQLREGLFFSVRKLIHSAARAPLVLMIEDLHWADKDTLALLSHVLEDIEGTRLLFAVAHRPGVPITWERRLNYNEMKLVPFVEDEITRFVQSIVKVDRIALSVRQKLKDTSLGNPLFVEEMIRQMLETSALMIETDDAGARILRPGEGKALEIPATLHSLIASRLDRVSENEREFLRWAAVFGSTFNLEELFAFLKERGIETDTTLKSLVQSGYLKEKSMFPRKEHRYAHDMIFEVVRNGLSDKEWRRRQVIVGRFLEAYHSKFLDDALDRIADHYLRGNDDIAAIHMGLRAGKKALSAHQFERAKQLLESVEKLWSNLPIVHPSPFDLYSTFIESLLASGELERVGEAFQKWESSGVPLTPFHQGKFWQLKMRWHITRDERNEALVASEKSLSAFGADPRWEALRYEVMDDHLEILLNLGRMTEGLHKSMKTLRELNNLSYPTIRAKVWATLGSVISVSGQDDAAIDCISKAQKLLPSHAPKRITLTVHRRMADALKDLGRYADTIMIHSRLIDAAKDAGLVHETIASRFHRAYAYQELGDYVAAIRDTEEAIADARQFKIRPLEIRALIRKADILCDLYAPQKAQEILFNPPYSTYPHDGPWEKIRKDIILSRFKEISGSAQELTEIRNRIASGFRALNYSAGVLQFPLANIASDAFLVATPIEMLVNEYISLVGKTHPKNLLNRWLSITAWFEISAAGGNIPDTAEPSDSLDTCPSAWNRQNATAAKIRWLLSQNRREEAKRLADEFKTFRESIAKNIPKEYVKSYWENPRYLFPTL